MRDWYNSIIQLFGYPAGRRCSDPSSQVRRSRQPSGPARRTLLCFTLFPTGVTRMFNLGMAEIVIICIIALLLFGNRLPGLARSLGKSFMELRKEVRGIEEDIRGPIR